MKNKMIFLILISWLIQPVHAGWDGHEYLVKDRNSTYDVVVYGATAGGVVAAISAAREGSRVLLIEPRYNVGGMVTGGLSHNDYGDKTVIGGMALEFYEKVADHYQRPLYFWRGPEPHVGEKIFRDWLKESGVSLLFGKEVLDVTKKEGYIQGITLSDESQIEAGVFIDATYEGDLMARAGVSYTVGREGIRDYDESWAGRRAILPDGHQMQPRISPLDDKGDLLPLIHSEPMVNEGEADKAVQGYGFRLIVTDDPANRVPFTKPEGYDPAQYALVKRYYETYPQAGNMVHRWPTLPRGKTDMNSSGPISTNVVNGLNWEYPEANYQRRKEIWQMMKNYTQGLLYFLSNDPSVPERIRSETSQLGLCRDEFVDNGHWPHQLYIRVARRMTGEYVMTQHDLEKDTVKYDAIGMGSYNIDVRHVQRTFIPVSRFPELHYEVYNEGYISIPVAPYEIPYRSLVPRFTECTNLIVPVCMSASFVANASIRMEPQYMIMGQAAGIAASMAMKNNIPVQQINIVELQQKLLDQKQVLSLRNNPYGAFGYDREIVIDNNMKRFTSKKGSWSGIETEPEGRYQMNFLRNRESRGTFAFKPWIGRPGNYEISIWYPAQKENSGEVTVLIKHSKGISTLKIDQRSEGGRWVSLGEYQLDRGYQEVVTLLADQVEGAVVADAIRLRQID